MNRFTRNNNASGKRGLIIDVINDVDTKYEPCEKFSKACEKLHEYEEAEEKGYIIRCQTCGSLRTGVVVLKKGKCFNYCLDCSKRD